MTQQQILSIYQDVAEITSKMLAAARNSDWDTLVSLEKNCAMQVGALKKNDRIFRLSEDERQQKIGLIKKILADDQEIRSLTEPRLAHLSSLLNSAGNERKLSKAYNANTG
ncbi:MAG: flagellar protein FliT [Oxalobacter sp.]|nr:MAG: flagellar protein FliT [Oxalobacter sp.]